MKITRQNYEPYFIDYLEGNLEESLVDEFIGFIQDNPDLKEELLLFNPLKLPAGDIRFEMREKLYKERLDLEDEFEQTAIASIEGDLSVKESAEFENYLSLKPEKRKEVSLFEKTKLFPETIIFLKKNKLYRRPVITTVFLWSSGIAAILVLAWITSVLLFNTPDKVKTGNSSVAIRNDIIEQKNTAVSEEKPKVTEKKVTRLQIDSSTEFKNQETNNKEEVAAQTETDITKERIPVPEYILPKNAIILPEKQVMALVPEKPPRAEEYSQPIKEERLIVDAIREKTGIDGFSFRKLARSGLDLAAKLSNKKFSYSTDLQGRVTSYAYDSKLLGLYIPSEKK